VFYGLIAAFFLTRLSGAMLVWPRPDAGSFNNFALFYLFCLVVVTAFANAAMALPMTREALEPGDEWRTAYFVIARREWALFANLLLLYVIVIGMVSVIVFAGGVGIAVSLPMIGHDGVWQGISLAPVMTGILALIAVATGLFLATRFGFFLAPIAVAEPPAGLLQSWSLSSGNFWRLLALSMALFVPIVVLALATDWATFGSQFGDAVGTLFSPSHDTKALFQMVQEHAGAIAAIWAGALLLLNAIFAGASADAYGQVEQDIAPSREYVSVAGPAFAMAATSPHLAVAELRRVEPEFVRTEEPSPVAEAPETITEEAITEEPTMQPVEPATIEQTAETTSVVEPAIAPVTHVEEPLAEIETAPVAEPPIDEIAITPDVMPQEEPLVAHEDENTALDPVDIAAPAGPDASPITPLPSFVKTQPSPVREPSEAA
jgi:hypothetical protein